MGVSRFWFIVLALLFAALAFSTARRRRRRSRPVGRRELVRRWTAALEDLGFDCRSDGRSAVVAALGAPDLRLLVTLEGGAVQLVATCDAGLETTDGALDEALDRVRARDAVITAGEVRATLPDPEADLDVVLMSLVRAARRTT